MTLAAQGKPQIQLVATDRMSDSRLMRVRKIRLAFLRVTRLKRAAEDFW